MKILCVKDNGYIKPKNDEADEVFSRIHNGAVLIVELKQARNPAFTARYFASVDLIVENDNALRFTERYELHNYIKEALGVDSIKEDKMDGVEFADFFERYQALVVTELMPDLPAHVFWNEVGERI